MLIVGNVDGDDGIDDIGDVVAFGDVDDADGVDQVGDVDCVGGVGGHDVVMMLLNSLCS